MGAAKLLALCEVFLLLAVAVRVIVSMDMNGAGSALLIFSLSFFVLRNKQDMVSTNVEFIMHWTSLILVSDPPPTHTPGHRGR